MNRFRILTLAVVISTLAPMCAVSIRLHAIEYIAIKAGGILLSPSNVTETICRADYCYKEYRFVLTKQQRSKNWIGFHNTFLSGGLLQGRLDDATFSELLRKPPNWHAFHQYPIAPESPFSILTVAPQGRRKIGMDRETVFLGSEDAISVIHSLYALFNVHIYVALGLASIALTGALRTSYVSRRISTPYSQTLATGLVVASACFLYSHVFDLALHHLGVPTGFVENAAKWVWGPAVCLLLFDRGRPAVVASALYIFVLAAAGGISTTTSQTFYSLYPITVALLALYALALATRRIVQGDMFQVLTILPIVHDALVINGIAPLFASTYLSPLSFFGWFAWKHIDGIRTLMNLVVFGQRQEALVRRLSESGSPAKEDDLSFADLATSLALATNAGRVSILVTKNGQPRIARFANGKASTILDGLTPPIFARVIQTQEEMFLVTEEQLSEIRVRSATQSDTIPYNSGRAIITPINDNGRVLGAIAITDLHDELYILNDPHHQELLKAMISVVKTEVTSREVKEDHEQHKHLLRTQDIVASEFMHNVNNATNSDLVLEEFGRVLNRHTGLRTVAFSFDSSTRGATYRTSFGLSNPAIAAWRQEPFFAKKENKLSPIAIAVNEERPIFVDDIRSFFGFLKEKSIGALRASNTKGFAALPVKLFGNTVGILFLLQDIDSQPTTISQYRFIEKSVELLALQLNQSELNARSLRQESALKKIIEPELIETVLQRREKGEQVVGVVENSFLFLLDLRGSTAASRMFPDPIDLAQRLSRIYEKADILVRSYGGYFEKGSGDGLLFTLKDDATAPAKAKALLSHLEDVLGEVATRELGVTKTIMIAHYGRIFRGIMGSTARMAWDNCGSDLIDTFDLEKKAKKEAGIVLAISSSFVERLGSDFSTLAYRSVSRLESLDGTDKKIYLLDKSARDSLRKNLREAEKNAA